MKKTYEVPGMMEWHPVFKTGRVRMTVAFTGGHLCGGASTPASCETSDPVVQAVIENSGAFRSGRIRVAMGQQPSPTRRKSTEVFEYSTEEEIYDFLEKKKGVPLERLCNKDSCYTEAKRLDIILKKRS